MSRLTNIEGVRSYLDENSISDEEVLSLKEQSGGFTSYTYKIETPSGVFYLKHSAEHSKGAQHIDNDPKLTIYEAKAYELLSRRLARAVLPTLISVDEANSALVLSSALEDTDTTLKDMIHEQHWPLAAAHEIGYHIGTLHGGAINDSEQVRDSLEDEERFFSNQVAWLSSDLAFNSVTTQDLIQDKLRTMTDAQKTLLIGDLAPRNVVTDGERVAFIDFANAVRGWPAFDVGFLAGHVLLNAIEFNELTKGLAFLDTFKEGYETGIDEYDATAALDPSTTFKQARLFAAGWMHRRTFESYSDEDIPPDELNEVNEYINSLVRNEERGFIK